MPVNTQIKLASRPVGMPKDSDFSIEKTPTPDLKDGEILLQTIYISLDPAMRGWMNEARSYVPPVEIGAVMRAGAVSKVIESKNPAFEVGKYVVGMTGVQEYTVSTGDSLMKIDTVMAPLPVYLSTLGMPGFTAYFGLLKSGEPKEGETVLVSGAAGAVGAVVGQIAKIKGCHVVGIAGGPEKCSYLTEQLGFDASIDYKNEENLYKAIRKACPKGVDIYFDNVGGEMLEIALQLINLKARIIICGAISQYNNTTPIKGPANYLSLLVNRAKMEGILVTDNIKEYPVAAMEMGTWMQEGRLKSKEHIEEGIENFLETFHRLFSGKKMGKLVLKVGEE